MGRKRSKKQANKIVDDAMKNVIEGELILNDPKRLYVEFIREMERFKSLGGNTAEEFKEYLEKKEKSNEELRSRNFEEFKQLVNKQ